MSDKSPGSALWDRLSFVDNDDATVMLDEALRTAYLRGLEDAAKIARSWGHAPPNPNGRRAALATAILACASEYVPHA